MWTHDKAPQPQRWSEMYSVRNTKRLVSEEQSDWREIRCLFDGCWLQRQCSGSWSHEMSNICELRRPKTCSLLALFWRKGHLQQQQINITSNDNDDHVNNNEHTWITWKSNRLSIQGWIRLPHLAFPTRTSPIVFLFWNFRYRPVRYYLVYCWYIKIVVHNG